MSNFVVEMKILIINGSPRKKGLVSQMRGGTAMHPELTEKDKQKCHQAINRIYV
jgi:hypothetical protein